MKTILIIGGVLVLIWVLYMNTSSTREVTSVSNKEKIGSKPSQFVKNDKYILVKNVSHEDLTKVLSDFCDSYNEKEYVAIPRLSKLSEKEFLVSFPYDVKFEYFAYIVNYLKYPMNIKWGSEVIAWTTINESDLWATDKTLGKNVILYIDENDKEYDNVFLTTEDNIGYKLGFAVGEEKQLLPSPLKVYVKPTFDTTKINFLSFIDFD